MKYKKYFLLFTVVYLFLSYTHIFAAGVTGAPGDYNYASSSVSSQIKQYLCAPTDASRAPGSGSGFFGTNTNTVGAANVAQGDLYACINKLYRFAIVIGASIGVFYLVIAGYIYMGSDGNQESVDKAKDMLVSTITAFVILLAGYILLKAINPDLIQFKQIQPGSLIDLTKFSTSTDFRIPVDEGGIDTGTASQTLSGDAKNLAQQVLGLHNQRKITLASAHASGISDNANALQNIKDAGDGKLAQRSSYRHESRTGPGGTTAIEPVVLDTIIKLESRFGNFRVSEIAGGVHSANSDHYTGKAFDIDQVNGSRVSASNAKAIEIKNACKSMGAKLALGPGDTGHSNHIHCSWTTGGAAPTSATTPPPSGQLCQASSTYNWNEPGTAAACAAYDSAFQQYGSMTQISNGTSVLKAIAYHESKCRTNLHTSSSHGIMQMQIATANTFKSNCSITENIDAAWFDSNPNKSICLTAAYLSYLKNSICGSSLANILAGYSNGVNGVES